MNSSDFIIENGVLTKYTGPGGDVVIPDGVAEIGPSVFENCNALTSVRIPDGVTAIGTQAFAWCHHLTHIHIPDSVTSIGKQAFGWCPRLCGLYLPDSVTEIGDGAFNGCNALADENGFVIVRGVLHHYAGSDSRVIIPGVVTKITMQAFIYHEPMTHLYIPDGVTEIGDSAFCGCEYLTEIRFPDSLKKLGNEVFEECFQLEEIRLPAGATEVNAGAFDTFHTPKRVIAPGLPLTVFDSISLKYSALLGFLENRSLYTDPEVIRSMFDYISCGTGNLIPYILKDDHADILAFCAKHGQITTANFEQYYLLPAQQANATACIAFLLDWKHKHLPADTDTDFSLN